MSPRKVRWTVNFLVFFSYSSVPYASRHLAFPSPDFYFCRPRRCFLLSHLLCLLLFFWVIVPFCFLPLILSFSSLPHPSHQLHVTLLLCVSVFCFGCGNIQLKPPLPYHFFLTCCFSLPLCTSLYVYYYWPKTRLGSRKITVFICKMRKNCIIALIQHLNFTKCFFFHRIQCV